MKTHKRKKSSRYHGKGMGTCGTGCRKKQRGSGMRGGKGMSGSGKRADHKKTLITKLYGNSYFGKKGKTSVGSKRDKRRRINLQEIEQKLEILGKKKGDSYEIELKNFKILGRGEVKKKLKIKAKEASQSAIDKVKKAGGEIVLPIKKEVKAEQKVVNGEVSKAKKE